VFIASLIAFVVAGAVSGLAIYALIQTNDPQTAVALLSPKQKTALEIGAAVFGFVSLCSLFGFIGSLVRSRRLVAIYVYMSYLILFLECISVIYGNVTLFADIPGSANGVCNVQVGGQPVDCTSLSNGAKAVLVTLSIIILLIQLYVVIVIRRYLQQLEEEQSYGRASKYAMGTVAVNSAQNTYYPHTPMQSQGTYAYADPSHSFGNHA
jgi:hypothetical protein